MSVRFPASVLLSFQKLWFMDTVFVTDPHIINEKLILMAPVAEGSGGDGVVLGTEIPRGASPPPPPLGVTRGASPPPPPLGVPRGASPPPPPLGVPRGAPHPPPPLGISVHVSRPISPETS